MAELADAADLKFADPKGTSGFDSRPGHTKTEARALATRGDRSHDRFVDRPHHRHVRRGLRSTLWAQFPMWVIGGAPPFYDSEALARHLYDIRTTAFIRIVMNQGIYVSMMIFAAGFRHLVRRARPESDWLGLLALVSAAVWLAVTLAADGLMGGAVLATLQGKSGVSAALPLVFGTLLIYNGSIAFAITGLFMAAAGWATLDSGVLPRWTGWIAWISAVLCALSIPAMFAGPADTSGFYNPGGWGPAIIANLPPLIWFFVVGVVLTHQSRSMN